MSGRIGVTRGSGNVFAGPRFRNPEEAPAEAELVRQISKTIERRG